MKLIRLETVRRLIPAGAVLAVLVFSFVAQTPSLASSTNNCGLKGYGYHDHGKACPNRPFPGHGNGVIRILERLGLPSPVVSVERPAHKTVVANRQPSSDMVRSSSQPDDTNGSVTGTRKGNHGHSHGSNVIHGKSARTS